MVNGSLCDLFAPAFLRVSFSLLLTRPNQVETSVHGCNPTLRVSVVLVSRKVNSFT